MDFTIAKTDLLPLLARAVPIAERKSAMPALANVLLTIEGTVLRVSATDLYRGVTSTAPADVAKPGSVGVPAKDLYERVKAMPGGPIQILVNDASQTTVKAVGSARRFTLHGIPGSEFPPMPAPGDDAKVATLSAAMLARLFESTHVSISADETRPHVNSLLVEIRRGTVLAVSTDGHRLTKMVATPDPALDMDATMLIPLAAIGDLRRMFGDAAKGETVTLAQSGAHAFVTLGDARYMTKLVDAQFPPWEQVVPKGPTNAVRAPRAAFADAVNAIRLASSSKTGGIKLTFGGGMARIECETAESGSGFDEVAVDYAGKPVTIGFNAQYILDALAEIDADEVLLGVDGELDPMLITPGSEPAGESFLAVLMPMRI